MDDFETRWALRERRLETSRAGGAVHLDTLPRCVEAMRGREIYNLHDHRERGTVRTVSDRGDVVVLWADEHSCAKNAIGLQDALDGRNGRVIGKESWLSPSDLADYVVGTPPDPVDEPAPGPRF